MRVLVLLSTLLFAAAIMAGCGGPSDSLEQLQAACERQIAEIADLEEESATPVASSTQERLEDESLVQCAGQTTAVVAAADDPDEDRDAQDVDATDEDAGDADEATEEPVELDPEARSLFATSCGGCHALADAGTSGAVGPVLDGTDLDVDGIANVIENGRGAMPGGLLQGDDVQTVAEYVAGAAAAS
jgi:mono/diheme cytochrome c family protein